VKLRLSLEARVGEIYWDMLDSQKSLPALFREAEEAMKLHQQREHVRKAAKTTLLTFFNVEYDMMLYIR
jgi:hypothetical protein